MQYFLYYFKILFQLFQVYDLIFCFVRSVIVVYQTEYAYMYFS